MASKDNHSLLPVFFLHLLLLPSTLAASVNPFTPRASLLRHWSRLFPDVDIPDILLSKFSPLNSTQLATFSSYLDTHTLRHHLPTFCSAANLFCDLKFAGNVTQDLTTDADFQSYNNNQFKRYEVGGNSGGDSFTNYSVDQNIARDTFARYGQEGNGKLGGFRNYELDTNVAASRFKSYDADSSANLDQFNSYSASSNVQSQEFSNYGKDSSGLLQQFSSYSENSNVIKNAFDSYVEDGNAALSQFSGYATSSNVVTNKFNSYDKDGNGPLSQFSNYANEANVASNEFKNYLANDNGGLQQFNTYGDAASNPENVFAAYGRGGHASDETFTGYGNSTLPSNTQFVEYNRDGSGSPSLSFTTYSGLTNNTNFKKYFDSSTTFSDYRNTSTATAAKPAVEAGRFFRQSNLVAGNEIPFPNIRDKMPKRSFLPRALADKLLLSSTKLPDLVEVFGSGEVQSMIARTIAECERPAVKDETKRCVNSVEAMAEFASSILGKTATVSTTASTAGSGQKVVVGKVVGRNNGKETRSVSCHQSLFPSLVYYCHMVPRVTVYDVELVVRNGGGGKSTTNQAVAICHQDTTQWSPTHAAFVALGPAPGKIEVCHFVFENDLIWVARD